LSRQSKNRNAASGSTPLTGAIAQSRDPFFNKLGH